MIDIAGSIGGKVSICFVEAFFIDSSFITFVFFVGNFGNVLVLLELDILEEFN